jgi:DNA-binding transcriptional MerR regulator
MMEKTHVTEFIRKAQREGMSFEEIDQFLLAEVPGLTIPELAESYRTAADRDHAEADELRQYLANRST